MSICQDSRRVKKLLLNSSKVLHYINFVVWWCVCALLTYVNGAQSSHCHCMMTQTHSMVDRRKKKMSKPQIVFEFVWTDRRGQKHLKLPVVRCSVPVCSECKPQYWRGMIDSNIEVFYMKGCQKDIVCTVGYFLFECFFLKPISFLGLKDVLNV